VSDVESGTGAEQGRGGVFETLVPAPLDGERVDRAVALLTGLARSAVAELVSEGRVAVDGQRVEVRSRTLVIGQTLRVDIAPKVDEGPRGDAGVVFTVVYEDPHLIVVDKPAGLVVHHGAGHRGGTLVDGLLARFPELADLPSAGAGDLDRPGIVHRLDKGTSGLLVVARNAAAFHSLSGQLREHTAGRHYRALVAGTIEDEAGVVDAPIGRSPRQPTRMAVTRGGRPARTAYTVVARYREPLESTLIEATLDTGRTHQVRVHLAAIGHPVFGDDRYWGTTPRPGPGKLMLAPGRLFLHACRLSLDHPDDGERRTWESPLPPDLAAVLETEGR
jgi:23S rRNA pseudouridine1911/1915/1917 synthase